MPAKKKIDNVTALQEKLAKTKAFFLTDYKGLTHQQMEGLRKTLKKAEAEFSVVKNTLFKIALEKSTQLNLKNSFNKLVEHLKHSTAVLLVYGDEVAPIKELAQFMKNTQLPKVKAGYFSGVYATETDFQRLSLIPTREVLMATLAVRLNGPIYGFHRALRWNLQGLVTTLDNIKNKKGGD